ncbi:MAG TPA: DUF4352 domain-containing protein [Flexivirga sp.]|uniref:DUF4352 domain-containing protein n=1 Tax=Flexivirga sp. TaxID=1962927 RepID=UPI002C81DE64|nr:DUF4352 domain-containing protein [Flexivirga sp.]HWC24445.1 DUF4352 domain-containing protein [Flexivirga sp.]
MTQYNGPQDPTQWSGLPPRSGGSYPPVPPGPAPKKRNWFARHKIMTGFLGLFAVIVIGVATTSGGGSSNPEPTTAATQPATSEAVQPAAGSAPPATAATKKATKKATQKTTRKAAPKAQGIGTPVKSGDLEFTVTKVVRGQKQVGADFMAQKAQGSYTLVHVTVRNVGNDSETLLDSDQKIKDADNKTYSPDSGAELAMDNNDVWLAEINPGNAVDGVLVYDMPVGVQATAIDFSGGLFDDAKTVQLH